MFVLFPIATAAVAGSRGLSTPAQSNESPDASVILISATGFEVLIFAAKSSDPSDVSGPVSLVRVEGVDEWIV